MNWRPDDWVGIKKKICFDQFHKGLAPQCKSCSSTPDKCQKAVEVGASAMLSALIKWLDEPCYEHPIGDYEHDCKSEHFAFVDSQVDDYEHWHYAHRKDCPQCLNELKEANK
jgi:hypothetical protein